VDIDAEEVSSFVSTLKSLSWGSVVKILLLAVVLVVLVKLLNQLFGRLIARSKIDKSLHGFLRATIKIVLYFMAITILAGSLNIDVTSLIAVLSVAGLALSLAIQGALSNLAGGIVILTTKPLHVGDYVAVGSDEGTVEEIGMTYTRLLTPDSRSIYIPNSTVTSSNVVNYTVDGKRRVDLVVTASYNAPVDAVKAALEQAAGSVATVDKEMPLFARVSGYQDSNIAYTVRAWCKSADYWDAYFDLMEAVKRSFDENGIAMTYPHLNVHLDK
jgi:small conductance mechanosensitive channel